MHVFHMLLGVSKAARLSCTPDVQQENDRGRKHRDLNLGQRLAITPSLDIGDATARPRRIGANCERGERQRGGLPRRRDEWPVNENLDVVVCYMQSRRLAEVQEILPTLVPAHCGE